jgi:putative ABC transport system ATP-binding protein
MADALVLDGVSKIYEVGGVELVALHEVDLTVAEEEVVTLLGPSGSGKTTLLSIAGGLLSPTSGKVIVGGKNITKARARKLTAFRRKRIGFIFQAVNLVPFLTARENLLVVAELARRDRGAAGHRADRLLEELGLGHRMNNLPSQLSGGERQRVAIGRALMNQPALVLVDEPTSALDSDLGTQVMELIVSEVKARGAAAVIVTHDQRMARYGDQILTMADGRIAGMAPRPEFTLGRGPAPSAALEAGRDLRALPAAASGQVGPPSGRFPAAGGHGPGTGQWPAARDTSGAGHGPGPGTGQWPASARDAADLGPDPGTGQWPASARDFPRDPGTGQRPAAGRDTSGFDEFWSGSRDERWPSPGPAPAARGRPPTGSQPPISMEMPSVLPAPDRQWRRPATPPRNQPAGRRPPPAPPQPQPPPRPHPVEPEPVPFEEDGFRPRPFEAPGGRGAPPPPGPAPTWGTPDFFADPPPGPRPAAPLPRPFVEDIEPVEDIEHVGYVDDVEPETSDRAAWLQQLTPPPTKAQPRPLALPDRPIWPTRYWAPGQGGPAANGHHPDDIVDAEVLEDEFDYDFGEYDTEDDR